LTYLLTQKNINLNIKSNFGYTILHTACKHINKLPLEIFKVLIETHGFDVNIQNNFKSTPVHYALCHFDPNDGGNITVLTYLLSQNDINGNIKNENGYTLLHNACEKINILPLEIFKVLIETHGADINAQDNDKTTPIHSALDQFKPNDGGDINVLAYLINQKNLNVNIKNRGGYTLLHYACIINPSRSWHSLELKAECNTIFCQIVEFIAKRCVQEVFDEKTPLEATPTI
jgi:ankyrin repeat protein